MTEDEFINNTTPDYECDVCGDTGVIDMGWSNDFHIAYYCNYCEYGNNLEDRNAHGDAVMKSRTLNEGES